MLPIPVELLMFIINVDCERPISTVAANCAYPEGRIPRFMLYTIVIVYE